MEKREIKVTKCLSLPLPTATPHLANGLILISSEVRGLPWWLSVKESACNAGAAGAMGSLGQEAPLKKGMETLSSILAWRIPWTEEISRLESTGLKRVGHD